MAIKKYVSLDRLADYNTLIQQEITDGDSSGLSSANSYTDGKVESIKNGNIVAAKATEATSAASATKATQDGNGKVISSTYETKSDANSKLTEAKTYADNAANAVKNDLLNGAGGAYDTLKELEDLIDNNTDAIDALETVASGKADKTHSHAVSDVSGLQTALDGKAASSHGTHVSFSTTAPVMDGTASVGSASTVARSDHKHPIDTSRAAKTEFDSHVSDTTGHITATERTNWNAAKTHADASHAPSNAEKNQNAFSNIAVSGQTTVAADTVSDTVTFAGSNVSITTDATNDKVTFSVADGSTSTKGIVKLTNSTSSTSTTTAATPSSVKSAYDLANTAKTNAAAAQARADEAYTFAESKAASIGEDVDDINNDITNLQTQIDGKANSTHTHGLVTKDTAGFMSSDDYGKLSGIQEYATHVVVDGVLSSSSSNAIENMVVTNALAGKANTSHTHAIADVTNLQSALDGKAASSHTHKYAGSSSAGGAATSANKVNSSLSIKLNSGTTEGTNLFTFNGSAAKAVNITPSAIGAATSSHTHDDRYYTETEVDTKLSGKANSSHGNHVPATQTASNNTFLRNDNTWQTVTPANIGAAASSHTHTVANISDLTATAAELNYMDGVTSNVQTQLNGKAASSHSHTYDNVLSSASSNAVQSKTLVTKFNTLQTQIDGKADSDHALSKGTDTTATKTLSFGGTFTAVTDTAVSNHKITDTTTTFTMPSDRLFVTLTPTGTTIPANAELNSTTYLKVGRYFCSKNVDAATIKNCPLSVAFMMEVSSPLSPTIDNETTGTWVYRLRKITAYNTGVQYVQYCYAGGTANSWSYGAWFVVPRSSFTIDSTDNNGGAATLGSATKPVYVSSNGTLTACSKEIPTVYTEAECTTFTSDTGTCTPAAVKKAVGLFDPKAHNHAASSITSGTLSTDRLPTIPITKGGTNATTATGAMDNLGCVYKTLLWENASLGSDFAAQTITVPDLSQYDGYEIIYVSDTTSSGQKWRYSVSSYPYVANSIAPMESFTQIYYILRQARPMNNTSMYFTDCFRYQYGSTTSTQMNSGHIPYRIYGLKGVV